MSLWRNKDDEAARRIREQCDEYDRTGAVAKPPKFKSGGLVPDARLAISFATGKTSFDSPFAPGVYNQGETLMLGECAWCGSSGIHKPDCQALSRNYPRTSLGTQREMTERLRSELDQMDRVAYFQGSAARPSATVKPEPPKDVRTDLQKRFDAIAEELAENK